MYFVGMVAADGRVNLSPKGLDSLRVLGPGRVAWLNVTGSGNETAAHILQPPRMTLMFCAFEGPPLILRLYGQARMVQPDAPDRAQWADLFPALPGARQVFVLDLDFVQTSCGMAMPRPEYREQRGELNAWAERRTPEELGTYRQPKNSASIDGFPTGLPGGEPPRTVG